MVGLMTLEPYNNISHADLVSMITLEGLTNMVNNSCSLWTYTVLRNRCSHP